MSDTYSDFYNAQMIEHRVCGVAYTINDRQPVICTHIGDQPLFYFEEEMIEDEDDGFFDIAELDELAREVRILKEEIAGMGKQEEPLPQKTLRAYCDFSENAESISQTMNFYLTPVEQKERLTKIKDILSQSRLAAAYLNMLEKQDVKIQMSEQVEDIFYDRNQGIISLYPHMKCNDHILLLARELRRHWQHRQGVLINPMTFKPENAILINRAQEADLAAAVVRIAWELQLAGHRDVWERVENSPLSDLARSFAREAFINFRTINDGTASAAVFESWFLSERCRSKDKQIIRAMLADYKGYVFDNDKSSSSVTAELIAKLGEMPFGKNYLATHAHTIMDDPVFTEVRDRSSANFLWFIKFERSYKETEQHLQTESDLSTHDIRHDLLSTKSQGPNNAKPLAADILQLSEYRRTNNKIYAQPKSKRGADIIDLKRWYKKG